MDKMRVSARKKKTTRGNGRNLRQGFRSCNLLETFRWRRVFNPENLPKRGASEKNKRKKGERGIFPSQNTGVKATPNRDDTQVLWFLDTDKNSHWWSSGKNLLYVNWNKKVEDPLRCPRHGNTASSIWRIRAAAFLAQSTRSGGVVGGILGGDCCTLYW